MNDTQGYLTLMRKGLKDKTWWLEYLNPQVTTIIDFGCASGDLFRYINHLFPKRFRYVGIDNNIEFLSQCPHIPLQTWYFHSLQEVWGIEWGKAILIFNSVCHEIYSYDGVSTLYNIFDYAQQMGVRQIAIRDMYLKTESTITSPEWQRLDKAFQMKYPKQYVENQELNRDVCELAMKYTYLTNWDRELTEKYFHPLVKDITSVMQSVYRIDKIKYFSIPQQIQRIERDCGEKWLPNTTTHVKILINRQEG